MKTQLLCSLFCFLFLPALKAQTDFRFADSTAQWNVLYVEGAWCLCSYYSTTTYTVTSDTVIAGLSYQVINNSSYIRKDSADRVFKRTVYDSTENLIYDFSKDSGDVFTINGGNPVTCRVDSVDTINIKGPRKRMYITYNTDDWRPDMWVEGIGSLYSSFISPGWDHTIFDGGFSSLLCFFEHGNNIYHDTAYQVCKLDTIIYMGIKNNSIPNKETVSPNPTNLRAFEIRAESYFPAQTYFQLFDITGRMILQKPLSEKVVRMELDDISAGLYLYTITSQQELISSGKLVVQ
jgi:hypothetical protein